MPIICACPLFDTPYALDAALPWDHLDVKPGREFLKKEQTRSVAQLQAMAAAGP
jgi:hypothetical protein